MMIKIRFSCTCVLDLGKSCPVTATVGDLSSRMNAAISTHSATKQQSLHIISLPLFAILTQLTSHLSFVRFIRRSPEHFGVVPAGKPSRPSETTQPVTFHAHNPSSWFSLSPTTDARVPPTPSLPSFISPAPRPLSRRNPSPHLPTRPHAPRARSSLRRSSPVASRARSRRP